MPSVCGRKFRLSGRSSDQVDGVAGLLVIFAAFSVYHLVSMMTRCAGTLYSSWQIEFDSSASQTGAIASTMSSCSYFACLGVSLCFVAATVAVAQYYKKYYAIAIGFTSAGLGLGIVVFPPLISLLLDTYGWRGTMLITAAMCSNICVAGALYRRPQTETKSRLQKPELDDYLTNDKSSEIQRLPEPNQQDVRPSRNKKGGSVLTFLSNLLSELRLYLLLKSYRFTLFCMVNLQTNFVYSCFLIFLIPLAQACGIDEQEAPFLLSLMGFGSLGARFVSGFFVTRKIPVEVGFTVSLVLFGLGACCAQAETYASLAASACLVGFGTGANKTLNTVLLRKIVGLSNMASGMGILYAVGGFGDLVGPILAGLLYDKTGSPSVVFYVVAGICAASAVQMLLFPLLGRMEPGLPDNENQPVPV
ncbi:monocarboxylate transporter 12-like [Acanthaster planci]|uniref:Monocarboxylate transporter 12-like n=1 Tax=Acanthaster planci TaxID=133434 RepID=A0A8B7ZH86_ACAPL|nr:monocarboxylate transporter 12-like [Acanthaster planci]